MSDVEGKYEMQENEEDDEEAFYGNNGDDDEKSEQEEKHKKPHKTKGIRKGKKEKGSSHSNSKLTQILKRRIQGIKKQLGEMQLQ